MEHEITFGILTVSDRCFINEAVDTSGPKLKEKICNSKFLDDKCIVKECLCVPDEFEPIEHALLKWCDEDCLNVVLTVGGTGFGVRDITPEITSKIIKRPAPALSMAITNASLKITPYAMLSRGVSGIRNQTLIINLPGSEKAACECFEVVAPTLGHAVALLTDAKKEIEENHQRVQNQVSPFTVTSKVDTRNVAGRPRESTWPMIEVNTGQKLIEDNIPYENIEYHYESLSKCIGRVLAEDIIAPAPFPPFPAAMKDGYAVLSTDGMDLRSVVGSSVAGSRIDGSFVLMPGECMRVNTGCPIPNGADAVVQVEDTALSQSSTLDGEEIVIMVKKQPTAGLDIRSVGSDIAEGEIVLKKNTLLGSVELGLLATLGITQIPVYKLVSVSVISTGDELVEPSEQLADGKIRDSNKTTLMSLIRENGRFLPLDLGISLDNPSDLLATLLCAMTRSDVVVTTGSVSMGDRDYLKHVLLTDLNATIHFGRLNMKPGKPTTFATCIGQDGRKKMVFCLPGNPVSAFVTFHLFVLPALRILSGYKKPFPTLIKVKLDEEIKLDPRPEYRRAILEWCEQRHGFVAKMTGNQISSRLTSCHRANGLLVLPSSLSTQPVVPAYSMVNALVIGNI